MADMLQTGSAWLEAQRHAHVSHAVTYHRGEDSVELNATVGMTQFEVEREHGIETWESRDFLIRTEDLVLAGELVEPAAGDRIRETVVDRVQVYEVMAPGDESPWRYSDQWRRTLRVHTKLVDTET